MDTAITGDTVIRSSITGNRACAICTTVTNTATSLYSLPTGTAYPRRICKIIRIRSRTWTCARYTRLRRDRACRKATCRWESISLYKIANKYTRTLWQARSKEEPDILIPFSNTFAFLCVCFAAIAKDVATYVQRAAGAFPRAAYQLCERNHGSGNKLSPGISLFEDDRAGDRWVRWDLIIFHIHVS